MKRVLFVTFFLALGLSACSLASDITPPPGYHPTAAPTAAPVTYPIVPPDPTAGATIFANKCAPCHGSSGMGDGPQAASLPNPPAAIGSPEVARLARPLDWYNIITNGRMDQFMPPWKSALSDRQRWDVLAFVYTLSSPANMVAQGKTLYDAQCASCHGPKGKGDGPQSASSGGKMIDWTDLSLLAQKSANDLFNVMTNGVAPAMQAYGDKLNENDRWALTAYIRTLSFAGVGSNGTSASAGSPTPAAVAQVTSTAPAAGDTPAATATTPQATSTPGTPQPTSTPGGTVSTSQVTDTPGGSSATAAPTTGGTPAPAATLDPTQQAAAAAGTPVVIGKTNFVGKVNNTTGQAIPANTQVTLQTFDGMTQVGAVSVPVTPDGTFTFSNVDVVANRVYMAQLDFNKTPFTTDPVHASDITPGKDFPLTITLSAASPDFSVLKAQRLHVFFNFSTSGVLQVAELFIIQNPTDKALQSADAANPSLKFELPAGATNLQFQDGTLGDGRYVKTENGFADSQNIAPQGTIQELFAYEIPYNNQASLSVPIPMPVDSAIVMVPAGSVDVSGPLIQSSGTRDVEGSNIAMFTASNLTAGSKLDMTVSGMPAATTGSTTGGSTLPASNSSTALIIGLGVFGLALILGGVWLLRQRRAQAAALVLENGDDYGDQETAESILDAIVALDDLYQAGSLSETTYKELRAERKSKLKKLRGK